MPQRLGAASCGRFVTGIVRPVDLTDRALTVIPAPIRKHLLKRREEVKFAVVGAFCYFLTTAVYYALKLSVLATKSVTALTIATILASVVSYLLNRQWSFRTRGGRRRHHEASLFFVVSAVAVAVTVAPQAISRYVLELRTPYASRPVQEVADFVSGLVVGTVLGMVFRLWAFRRWVFPEANARPARPGRGEPAQVLVAVGARSGAADGDADGAGAGDEGR